MATGYRSLSQRHLGGASAKSLAVPGVRSIAARWLGGASAYTGPARPGYRSILAYWLGGACSYQFIEPPSPEKPVGGGGMGYRRSLDLARRKKQEDEEIAILIPLIHVTING
jgi:hypothetical protein